MSGMFPEQAFLWPPWACWTKPQGTVTAGEAGRASVAADPRRVAGGLRCPLGGIASGPSRVPPPVQHPEPPRARSLTWGPGWGGPGSFLPPLRVCRAGTGEDAQSPGVPSILGGCWGEQRLGADVACCPRAAGAGGGLGPGSDFCSLFLPQSASPRVV